MMPVLWARASVQRHFEGWVGATKISGARECQQMTELKARG